MNRPLVAGKFEIPMQRPGRAVNPPTIVYYLGASVLMPLRRPRTMALLGVRVNVLQVLLSLPMWP